MDDLDIDLGICRVRPLRTADAEGLARHADDREVSIQLRDGFPSPYTLADAQGWLELVVAARPATDFAIEVEGEAAGAVGLIPGEARSAEVGYWLGRRCWGRGIATAAVRALSAHAFDRFDLDRLRASVFAGNAASVRVLEKAGYAREGLDRAAAFKDGRTIDLLRFGLARGDHRPGPNSSTDEPRGGTGR